MSAVVTDDLVAGIKAIPTTNRGLAVVAPRHASLNQGSIELPACCCFAVGEEAAALLIDGSLIALAPMRFQRTIESSVETETTYLKRVAESGLGGI